MINKLRIKLIRIGIIATTTVLIAFNIGVAVTNYISIKRNQEELLIKIADNEGKIPNNFDMPDSKDFKPKEKREVEDFFRARYFVIRYDDNGNIFQSNLESIASVSQEDLNNYLNIAKSKGEGFGYTNYYRYLVTHNGENKNMAVFLDVYQDMNKFYKTLINQIIASIICDVVVFFFLNLHSRKMVEPFIENNKKQKQFITNASHELKTPITVISTSLKILEMENGKQKWIDKAQYQVTKLTALVNNLVTLSKLNEDESPLRFKRFNLSDSLIEVVESFEDFAKKQNLSLSSVIEDGVNIVGDEYYLKSMTTTLVENAIKYASKNSVINIKMSKNGRNIKITIDNAVDDFNQDDVNKLFERFYRTSDARASEVTGSGIGLSIVKQIVEGHKGTIEANLKDKRLEFKIILKERKD